MRFVSLLFVWCLLYPFVGRPQNSHIIIRGFIQDNQTGERLIGATIQDTTRQVGVVTNRYGYFSLEVPVTASVSISYVGYQTQKMSATAWGSGVVTMKLDPSPAQVNEVTVRRTMGKDTPDEVTMGRFTLPLDLIKKAPALLGETDILKTIQLLPGVQSGTEGTVGLNVRGGSPDQNLILLDGMTLYNVNHLFGFLSVINTDAVAQADFLKSSFPARYGGRLSSVLDIALRDGNARDWKGQVGISPVASRFTVEGPLKKDVASVLISGRRTWLDALYWAGAKLAKNPDVTRFGFYDLSAKLNYRLGASDRLFLSLYTSQDSFGNSLTLSDSRYRNQFSWGNKTLGLRWNHTFGKRLFSNTTLSYTNFQYALTERYSSLARTYTNQIQSGIKDVALKTDLEWYAAPKHTVRFGAAYTNHTFRPEIRQLNSVSADSTFQPSPSIRTGEVSVYAEDDWSVGSRLRFNAGIHYAAQGVGGRLWPSAQPRLSARYTLGEKTSLKLAYNQMTQYLHLLTNSSVGLPTDLWVPVTNRIPPEQARVLALGYNRTLSPQWNLSVETYYKQLINVLEYKEGASFLNTTNTPWEDRVSVGNGQACGAEFYLEKVAGRTRGWLSYTLSWANRRFADLNQGQTFPYKYDRRHNLAAVYSYDLTPSKSLSANFVYSSGYALTVAGSRYPGSLPGADLLTPSNLNPYTYADLQYYDNLPDLRERNNYRTPAYHRLDVSYRTTRQKLHGRRTWVFACYNLYSHANAFYLFYDKGKLKQFSLFPALPSVTYQYEF